MNTIRPKTLFIARLAILIAFTLVIQMAGLPQPVTGPLVNAMLIITTVVLGSIAGVALGCATPVVALLRGQLPAVLAPMVPFIAVANALLVIVFHSFFVRKSREWHVYAGIIAAAIVKYLFLMLSAQVILPVVFGYDIPSAFIIAMSTPQLITALVGGLFAVAFIKLLQRSGIQ
jgi:hypothetical protein